VSPSTIKKARTAVKNFIKKPKEERTIEFDPLGMLTGSNMNIFQAVLLYVELSRWCGTISGRARVPVMF
jgi:hypothetical protein